MMLHSKNMFEKIIRINRERIYIPSRLLDCDSAAAGSLDVLDVTKSKYWCNISV